MVTKPANAPFDTEGLRSFTDPSNEDVVYYIAPPGADDLRGADYEYSKVYTKSLVEGITTASEMTDILMRRGIIGPEFEQRAQELSTILGERIRTLEVTTDIVEKQTLAVEVAEARDELFKWNQRLNAPLSNTCEHLADDARLEYITSRIIRNEDGSHVWETFNKYLVEKNQGLAQKSRFEVMLYLQGLDSDFLDKTPEQRALREVGAELAKRMAEADAEAELAAKAEAEALVEKVETSVEEDKPQAKPQAKPKKSTKSSK